MKHIRFSEYDPNPLLSLCKRRRRTSTSISTEEKHLPETIKPAQQPIQETQKSILEQTTSEIEHHKEKKRLKKKKREKIKEKLLKSEDKKKKKKHRCIDEFCKHKKHHKKHKKHRKHHDKSGRSRTESEDSVRQEFICEIINEEESKSAEEDEEDMEPNTEEKADRLNAIAEKIEEDESSQQSSVDDFANYEAPANPDDEVTMDDILEAEDKVCIR